MENIQYEIWSSCEDRLTGTMQKQLNMNNNNHVTQQLYRQLVNMMWRQLRVRIDNWFNNR
jgi:hypothetical protein